LGNFAKSAARALVGLKRSGASAGAWLGAGVALGAGVGVALGVGAGVALGTGAGVALGVGVGVALGEGVGVLLGVSWARAETPRPNRRARERRVNLRTGSLRSINS
tara:strand:- start:1621 stop:1938 length:318 start_codon:yes stop_codon:yes gene_type:complete